MRLDLLLVQRGLAESREKAKAMIMAGLVQVDKRLLDKPGHPIPVSAAISLKEPFPPYVSRGGLKLEAALDQFAVDVRDKVSQTAYYSGARKGLLLWMWDTANSIGKYGRIPALGSWIRQISAT